MADGDKPGEAKLAKLIRDLKHRRSPACSTVFYHKSALGFDMAEFDKFVKREDRQVQCLSYNSRNVYVHGLSVSHTGDGGFGDEGAFKSEGADMNRELEMVLSARSDTVINLKITSGGVTATTIGRIDRRADMMFHLLDCLLKPDEAEEVIGDLTQQYYKRLYRPRRAIWWLGCQMARIVYGVILGHIRSFVAAKAGRI